MKTMPQATSSPIDVNDPRAIASLVIFGVIGAMGTFTFLPMVVGNAVEDLGVTAQGAGLLASTEMAGRAWAPSSCRRVCIYGTGARSRRPDSRSSSSVRYFRCWLEGTPCSPPLAP